MQSHKTTSKRLLGAVVKFENNINYTRASGTFTNGGAENVELQPGVIFTGGATAAVFDTGTPAAFSGICATTKTVLPGATVNVAYVERGPAIVNTNEIDFPADAGQRTTLETAMTAAGFKLKAGIAGGF